MGGYVLGANPVNGPFPWLTLNEITQRFGEHGETGIDLGMAMGTPITSLTSGRVAGAGYDPSGGYIGVNTTIDGQPAAIYYQHLDLVEAQAGETVQPGTLLGYSGGQLSGGHHPSSPSSSSGPHLEVGINFPWGGGRNPNRYEPSYDPLGFLIAVAQGGATTGTIGAVAQGVVTTATEAPGFGFLAQALNDTMQFAGFDVLNPAGSILGNAGAVLSRALFVVLGVALLLGVASWLLRQDTPLQDLAPLIKDAALAAA